MTPTSHPGRIFIYGQHIKGRDEYSYVLTLLEAIKAHGFAFAIYSAFAVEMQKQGGDVSYFPQIEGEEQLLEYSPDIAVVLGGDGTILRAVTLLKNSGTPVLGINLGRLGFLASVEKSLIPKAIYQLRQGQYTLVRRSLLQVLCERPLFSAFPYGLNDITVSKRDTSSMITIHVRIDGQPLHAYWADGLIISTPTGSTGYSLSCGGPILFPDAANFVITPVAPHNLTIRPLVIPDDKVITLSVEGRTDSFMCTLDSRFETVQSVHVMEIRKAPFGFWFIQLQGQEFMQTLTEKLHWGRDKRN